MPLGAGGRSLTEREWPVQRGHVGMPSREGPLLLRSLLSVSESPSQRLHIDQHDSLEKRSQRCAGIISEMISKTKSTFRVCTSPPATSVVTQSVIAMI